jgi:O-antigen ligase
MKLNSQIFFASLCLLLATPFLAIGGLEFPYQTTRIITFSIAIVGLLGAVLWRMNQSENFQKKVVSTASHPVVQIYGIFIAWLFVRSIPVFLSETWWGTWARFDGIFFELSFLMAIVAIAAWASEFEFTAMQKKLIGFLGFILLCSLVIFPSLALDRYVGLLPEGRFNGSVGNPLYLAGLLLFVPWFAGRLKNTKITIGATVVALGFLVATDTRGAFLAAIVGAGIFFWESKKISQRIRVGIISVVVILGCVGIFALASGKISSVRSVTIATRVAMWKSGAQELMGQPLIGFGVGEHRNNIDRSSVSLSEVSYGEISDSTHSVYLDIALKGGLIALAIFLVWIVVVYRSISGEGRALSRATFVAYLVLIAAAPWMAWTTIPLAFLIALNIEQKKRVAGMGLIFTALSFVVLISAVITCVVTAKNSMYLFDVSGAVESKQFVNLPNGNLVTNKFLPFTKDFMIELLRLTMPTENISSAPSVNIFIEKNVRPAILDVEKRSLHPDALNVAATWASTYASSGLTTARDEWFERSLNLQQRALTINPERPAAVFQAADSLRELGRLPEAISMLKMFADKHPTFPEARFYHALMVDISGDTKTAFAIEQQIKKDFPNYGWKESIEGWFTDIEARAQKLPPSK